MAQRLLRVWTLAHPTCIALLCAACGRQATASAFATDLQPAIRVALDSFPTFAINRTPLATESATRRGDTVEVTLVERRGLRDPGKWDGPRLHVWVVGDRRIIRSVMTTTN